MEKATNRESGKPSGKRRPRGPKRDTDRVSREEVLTAEAPAGSRFKGYETILVRELAISAELVRYRRERWLTPEGKTIIAPLPEGLLGGFGANLRRFCLVLHAQGQVTTERLTAILNGIGMDISKRQMVRILTSDLDRFVAEDQAILRAGLASAPYISVDDTGARHAHRDGITTQIGGSRFSVFRTGRSKSRLNFLSLLRAGCEDYVINDAALDYMRQRKVAPDVITRLAAHPETSFPSQMAWYDHLVRLRLDVFDRTLVREVSEAALWGAVRHHGLMGNTVVVSDDAGQFRIPNHALCWVHAERLLQKLMPKTPEQTRKLEKVRDQIWASEIGAWLTASPYSSGIHFTSELHGRDLWLDITDFPERAPEVGSVRALMQLGRVASADFDRLVLVDGQETLFVVAETDLRSVGCQFVWPAYTGANPIDLMRRMIEALREKNGGRPIQGLTTTGSAGTSINAVAIVEDHLNVAWVDSARPGATVPDILDQRPDHMVGLEAPRVQASAMPADERLAFNDL